MVRLAIRHSASWFCVITAGVGLLITVLSLLRPGWEPIPLYVACQVGVLIAGLLGIRRFVILVAAGTFFVLVMAIHSGGMPWILYTLHFGIIVVGLVCGWRLAARYAILPIVVFLILAQQNVGAAFMAITLACAAVLLTRWFDGFIDGFQAFVTGVRSVIRATGSGRELAAGSTTIARRPENCR